jgi:hypothetical protein
MDVSLVLADTRPKVIVGVNSAGKGRGIINVNALKRTGISQVFVDTRCQVGAIAAPWRRTVDDKTEVSNAYGALSHLPEYADLQGGGGVNRLEAPELDPDEPLVTDHLAVMATTVLPADNDHQPYFPTASQSLLISFAYGELVETKQEGRKPLFANIRRKVLERSEYDQATGEPVAGMAFHARQILALGNVLAHMVRYLRPALVVTRSGAVVMTRWPSRSSISAISLRKAEGVSDRNASMRGATVSASRAHSRRRSWLAALAKFMRQWWRFRE